MNKKSKKWLKIYKNDKYVHIAKKRGIKSRSYFKIKEINNNKIIQKNNKIIELGSFPGGWTQYISNKIGNKGLIYNCDIKKIKKNKTTIFTQGDICKNKTIKKIIKKTQKQEINGIISDISPNLTGIKEIDIPKYKKILKIIIFLCKKKLKKNGYLITKIFLGKNFSFFLKKIKFLFKIIKIIKPNSSRALSKEIYILALKYKQ